MSNYNWARGTITIPTKDYPKVRDALIAYENTRQANLYAIAFKVYEIFKGLKFKRGTDRFAIAESASDAEHYFGAGNRIDRTFGASFDCEDRRKIALSIFPPQKDEDGKVRWNNKHTTRAQKPKRKDFPLANKSTRRFNAPDLTISLDPKTRVVSFDGDENNRAQERALEGNLARALFRALDRVTWTRGSGGKIIGNDEYNGDDCSEGGGANYVLHEWSKEKSARTRRTTSSYSSGGFAYGRRY